MRGLFGRFPLLRYLLIGGVFALLGLGHYSRLDSALRAGEVAKLDMIFYVPYLFAGPLGPLVLWWGAGLVIVFLVARERYRMNRHWPMDGPIMIVNEVGHLAINLGPNSPFPGLVEEARLKARRPRYLDSRAFRIGLMAVSLVLLIFSIAQFGQLRAFVEQGIVEPNRLIAVFHDMLGPSGALYGMGSLFLVTAGLGATLFIWARSLGQWAAVAAIERDRKAAARAREAAAVMAPRKGFGRRPDLAPSEPIVSRGAVKPKPQAPDARLYWIHPGTRRSGLILIVFGVILFVLGCFNFAAVAAAELRGNEVTINAINWFIYQTAGKYAVLAVALAFGMSVIATGLWLIKKSRRYD